MKLYKLLTTRKFLQVLVYNGHGAPYALRLDVPRILSFLSLFIALLGLLFLGTLMFFREYEISRLFQERILALEVSGKHKLANEVATVVPPPAAASSGPAPASIPVVPPVGVVASAPAPAAPAMTTEPAPVGLPAFSPVRARLTDLGMECKDKQCAVTVSMVPSRPGSAQGKLLLVLETQVKRIGTATHTDQTIKRFIVYPGFEELDAVSPATLANFDGKPFKFSSALQSSVTFFVGQSLMPVGLDAYVYDTNGQLVTHRRRDAETIP